MLRLLLRRYCAGAVAGHAWQCENAHTLSTPHTQPPAKLAAAADSHDMIAGSGDSCADGGIVARMDDCESINSSLQAQVVELQSEIERATESWRETDAAKLQLEAHVKLLEEGQREAERVPAVPSESQLDVYRGCAAEWRINDAAQRQWHRTWQDAQAAAERHRQKRQQQQHELMYEWSAPEFVPILYYIIMLYCVRILSHTIAA